MFDDFMEEVNREYSNLNRYSPPGESFVDFLYTKKAELEEKISNMSYNIKVLGERQDYLPQDISTEFTEERISNRVLVESLELALTLNKEFNDPFFKDGLLLACNDPKSIQLFYSRDGNVQVFINLDETAGTINDYAGAVKAVRKAIAETPNKNGRPKAPMTSGAVASHFWAEKFYGPAREGKSVSRRKWSTKRKRYYTHDVTAEQVAKYWNTMKARMALFGKPAPYWEIIDKGSMIMSGDKGGEAYPANPPTHFVENAQNRIKQLFERKYFQQFDIIQKEINDFTQNLRDMNRALVELTQAIVDE